MNMQPTPKIQPQRRGKGRGAQGRQLGVLLEASPIKLVRIVMERANGQWVAREQSILGAPESTSI